jgi:putative transcriptional regulator
MSSPRDPARLLSPRRIVCLIGVAAAVLLLETSPNKPASAVPKRLTGVAAPVSAAPPPQRPRSPSKPDKGKFLVASRDLVDPNFIETVVLLVDFNEKGAMGIVINRDTDIPLSEILPDMEALRGRTETVFRGGPVATDGLMLLVRSPDVLEGAEHVFGDVYVTASRELLESLAAENGQRYRAYAGYAGWGPGQLLLEIEAGSWHIVSAQAATVFDPSPAQVWKQLIRGLSLQFARVLMPRPAAAANRLCL